MHGCIHAWDRQGGRKGRDLQSSPSSALSKFFHLLLLQCHHPGWIILGSSTKAHSPAVNSVPGFTVVTPSPMLSTMPAASWPMIAGRGVTKDPLIAWSSERQTPVATIYRVKRGWLDSEKIMTLTQMDLTYPVSWICAKEFSRVLLIIPTLPKYRFNLYPRLFSLKPSSTFLPCIKQFGIICEIIVSEIVKSYNIQGGNLLYRSRKCRLAPRK